ncbi:MAG TPA: quinone oxidoreductase [Sphingomonas sp.]|uniref:quinone oxidoreductase family protein n=1 Tax=Sphingomonas sp. TaxID=28214 RepID=UPI002EDB3AB1
MADFRMMMRAPGGPEVIEREDISPSAPGAGRVLVRHRAIGLNFIDTYRRSGLYPVDLPAGLGTEAAGIVEAVGADVHDFAPGDRVAYATGPVGAYATARDIAAEHLLRLPDAVDDETAAAATLKGMTACFLIEDCAKIRAGQAALVFAAAGGVGSIIVQWLARIGVTTIAHTGSPEKADLAGALGATHALSCPMDGLAAAVRDLTAGRGVDCVFDGVGADSWQASLASVARRGLLITYGNASGPVPAFDALALMRAGSIFVTRPTLGDYAATADDLRRLAARLYGHIEKQGLVVPIGQRFALGDAAEAHRRLEARATHGSSILTVASGD